MNVPLASPPLQALQRAFLSRYPAEAARFLEGRPTAEVRELLEGHAPADSRRVWERFAPELGAQLLRDMDPEKATAVVVAMDPHRAALFLGNLRESQREQLLRRLPPRLATGISRLLVYPPDTAGALMDTHVLYFGPDVEAATVLTKLREDGQRGAGAIYVVDDDGSLLGAAGIQSIALADAGATLRDLARPLQVMVRAFTVREDVVDEFSKFRVTEIPVVDFEERLLGVIRHYTLVDIARDEGSADIATMVGVSKDERALSGVVFAVRKRLPWLQINLLTAFMAATVVGLFEETIARYTALAVLLPVVAGQSGNTGAQALAVTMRGLTLREVRPGQWLRIAFKEFQVGFWNGLAIAVTTAAGVFVWSQSAGLCLVIATAMVISMIMAGLAGAVIPMLLTAAGQDPAQSSSIFLTTVTDIVGFFSFLGIATLLSGLL